MRVNYRVSAWYFPINTSQLCGIFRSSEIPLALFSGKPMTDKLISRFDR